MTFYSRGIVRRGPRPHQLTDKQKDIIEAWARRGRRDRVIANYVGVPEHQVIAYRNKLGIKGVGNRGLHQESYEAKGLRPAHVRGEVGSREWCNSCEFAFQSAVMAAGGW